MQHCRKPEKKEGDNKDIDIVASTQNPESVMDFFTSLDKVEEIIAKGDTKSSIRLKTGINGGPQGCK